MTSTDLIPTHLEVNPTDLIYRAIETRDESGLMEALMKCGWKAHKTSTWKGKLRYPFQYACECGWHLGIDLLADFGCRTLKGVNVIPGLFSAVKRNDFFMAKFLVKLEPDRILDRFRSSSILDVAIKHHPQSNPIKMLELLLDGGAEKTKISSHHETPLHLAIKLGFLEGVQLLAIQRQWMLLEIHTPVVHLAIKYDRIPILKFLVTKDPTLALSLNREKETPFIVGAMERKMECLKILIQLNPNVVIISEELRTKLFEYLVRTDQLDMIEFLCSNGVFPSDFSTTISPVCQAIKCQNSRIFEYFLRLRESKLEGWTNLFIYQIIRQIIENGTGLQLRLLIVHLRRVKNTPNWGFLLMEKELFHLACCNGKSEMLEFLHLAGSSLDLVCSKTRKTPFQLAVEGNHFETLTQLVRLQTNVLRRIQIRWRERTAKQLPPICVAPFVDQPFDKKSPIQSAISNLNWPMVVHLIQLGSLDYDKIETDELMSGSLIQEDQRQMIHRLRAIGAEPAFPDINLSPIKLALWYEPLKDEYILDTRFTVYFGLSLSQRLLRLL